MTTKIPTTRAGIATLIAKMRRHPDYIYRVPTDAKMRQRGGPNRFDMHTYSRSFPSKDSFNHRVLIERQSPLMTVNNTTDPDVNYPEFSFSSRSLTDWHASAFCRLNNLKE